MATIKAYTTIEQSRKLAEILPLESADMVYTIINGYHTPWIRIEKIDELDKDDVLCWSLAALLGVLPNKIVSYETAFEEEDAEGISDTYYKHIELTEDGRYIYCYVGNGYKYKCVADNPVDACVAMIEKLHELKML